MRQGNLQHPSVIGPVIFGRGLQRDSFLDVLGHFMFVEKKEEKSMTAKAGRNEWSLKQWFFLAITNSMPCENS
jgi:hypothetical protein